MATKKIILDVDPGIDDAVALAIALFDPNIEVVAVTAVGGNVLPDQATRNLQAVIEQLDPPRWPRLGGGFAARRRIAGQLRPSVWGRRPGQCSVSRGRVASAASVGKGNLRRSAQRARSHHDRRAGSADQCGPRPAARARHANRADRDDGGHVARRGQRHASGRVQHFLRSGGGAGRVSLPHDQDACAAGHQQPGRAELRLFERAAGRRHSGRPLLSPGDAPHVPGVSARIRPGGNLSQRHSGADRGAAPGVV